MKQISKQEPQLYQDFIRQNLPTKWNYVSLSIGYELRMHILMEEQNYQCAYTEIHIEPEDSHIDHFRKQSLFPDMRFDWNNLLVSGNSEAYGAKCKDKKLKKQEDYQLLINPVIDNPKDYLLLEQRKQVIHEVKEMYKQFTVEELIKYIGKFESLIRSIYSDLKAIEKVAK
ncbi:hypothetical protein [Candidatus Marithrix sp. Canyon 246]|uniref:hypothetical protein n=1 Tax=Candidatus Marithrix sp. Canyon 246 TaxID=1827136 RepID=UPI00084A15FD|nr:hypothetical protein [Candidatus Marithrix sp. Canyon 246]